MKAFECKNKHFLAYTKETLPVRYHYTNNRRIGDMVLDVDNGWIVRFVFKNAVNVLFKIAVIA